MTEQVKTGLRCPKCGSRNIRRYAYGLLAPQTAEQRKEFDGKYVAGGCCVGEDDPAFNCNDCGADFGFERKQGYDVGDV